MQRFRFSDMWCLYPTHCQILVTSQHYLSIVAAADILKALGKRKEKQVYPSNSKPNSHHDRAMRCTRGAVISKGGSTNCKGGVCSTSEGGYYIKQYHSTQCHQNHAACPPVPHSQQQPVQHHFHSSSEPEFTKLRKTWLV
jgi:hypothetical protein